VLTQSIGKALAEGRFAHVPILDGITHDEELIFVAGLNLAVSGGRFVPVPKGVTDKSYESAIAAVLGVSSKQATAIASQYPPDAYGSPVAAMSFLLSDANFACPALQVDRMMVKSRVPTFAYQFNDDTVPQILAGPHFPRVATHSAEIQYLFPPPPNAPLAAPLNPRQETLATNMRRAWSNFAATGNPSSKTVPWPSFASGGRVLSLATPAPKVETDYAATHHCSFWAAN